ncbi:MAG: hypothetical protein LBV30_02790 [Propionibacteriaceae bacterium]|jgi:glucosamine--fructose-6-phosphate aminotransferase (isomerizing)|nr:hypothetical protein [Propionibacteriaceae bacterium]
MYGQIAFLEGETKQAPALRRIAGLIGQQISDLTPWREHPETGVNFTGMGASYAALAVPVRLLIAHDIPAMRLLASDVPDFAGSLHAGLMVAVSQSGRSTETIEAMSALTVPRVAVVNQSGGPLAGVCDAAISLGDEPDSYASTVGFTGTVIALSAIARAILHQDPVGEWADIEDLTRSWQAGLTEPIRQLVAEAAGVVSADLVAAGCSRASTEEGALLLREVARIPSAAAVTRNYLHGSMESAGDTLHVICGDGRELELANALAGAGHPTLLLTSIARASRGRLTVLTLPETTAPVRVVLETLVMQRLAAAFAQQRGIDIEEFVFANPDTKTSDALASERLA